MSNSIGGFFATLGIRTDTNSFDKSKHSLDSVTNAVSRMMGTVRNASAVMSVLTVATGKVANQEEHASHSIGLSTEALGKWKNAAQIAGVEANSLVSEMNTLEQKMLGLKKGNVDQGLATALGFLGFAQDYGTFAEMNAEQRIKSVFSAAKEKENEKINSGVNPEDAKREVASLVGDILGKEAAKLYMSNEVRENGLSALLERAEKINFVSSDQTKAAADFNSELNAATAAIKNLSTSFGSDLAKEFTPLLEDVNTWLEDNGEEIKNALSTVAEKIGIITDKIILIADKVVKPIVEEVIDNGKLVAEGLEEKDYDKVGKGLNAIIEMPTKAIWKGITGEETAGIYEPAKAAADFNKHYAELLKKEEEIIKSIDGWIDSYQQRNGTSLPRINSFFKSNDAMIYLTSEEGYNKYKNKIQYPKDFKPITESDRLGIQDGIIKPNGQVTKVAPDDWVFAFRNISDFAAGFMPRNYNSTSSEIVINQNITINGAKDMPQVVRQQAYIGVQNGILEAMQNNINRMQMMNGLQ